MRSRKRGARAHRWRARATQRRDGARRSMPRHHALRLAIASRRSVGARAARARRALARTARAVMRRRNGLSVSFATRARRTGFAHRHAQRDWCRSASACIASCSSCRRLPLASHPLCRRCAPADERMRSRDASAVASMRPAGAAPHPSACVPATVRRRSDCARSGAMFSGVVRDARRAAGDAGAWRDERPRTRPRCRRAARCPHLKRTPRGLLRRPGKSRFCCTTKYPGRQQPRRFPGSGKGPPGACANGARALRLAPFASRLA